MKITNYQLFLVLACLSKFLFPGLVLATELPPELTASSISRNLIANATGFRMISDSNTEIRAVIAQAQNQDDPFLFDLLRTLRKDVRVAIIIKRSVDANALWTNLRAKEVFQSTRRVRFIFNMTGESIKKWGRDPYIILHSTQTGQFTLLPSYPEDHGPVWISSLVINSDFGVPNIVNNNFFRIKTWNIEGGAVTSDMNNVFIGDNSVRGARRYQSGEPAVYERADVIANLQDRFGKKIIVLPAADSHSDRYHIPVGKTSFGERTSLLADPVALLRIVNSLSADEKIEAKRRILRFGMSYKDQKFLQSLEGNYELQYLKSFLNEKDLEGFLNMTTAEVKSFAHTAYVKKLDETERLLRDEGIHVVRVPALSHSFDYEEFITKDGKSETATKRFYFPLGFYYTNIIQDSFQGKRTAIIPRYGIKRLDQAVYNIYKSLQCYSTIHQIRSVIEGTQGGGPRCRVQILGVPAPDEPLLKH